MNPSDPTLIVSNKLVTSASFTRPANTTPYASGNLVANSTTAGSVTPLQFSIPKPGQGYVSVQRARIKKSSSVLTNAQFRLHLYTASPTIANGDGAAWSTTESGYLGSIDVTVDKAFSDSAKGIGAPGTGTQIIGIATGQVVYGLLEARAAYTPTSAEVLTVELEAIAD